MCTLYIYIYILHMYIYVYCIYVYVYCTWGDFQMGYDAIYTELHNAPNTLDALSENLTDQGKDDIASNDRETKKCQYP